MRKANILVRYYEENIYFHTFLRGEQIFVYMLMIAMSDMLMTNISDMLVAMLVINRLVMSVINISDMLVIHISNADEE